MQDERGPGQKGQEEIAHLQSRLGQVQREMRAVQMHLQQMDEEGQLETDPAETGAAGTLCPSDLVMVQGQCHLPTRACDRLLLVDRSPHIWSHATTRVCTHPATPDCRSRRLLSRAPSVCLLQATLSFHGARWLPSTPLLKLASLWDGLTMRKENLGSVPARPACLQAGM